MLKKILIGLAALLAILAIIVATRPDTFHVERSAQIAAAPEAVYPNVLVFEKWGAWSPWEKKDPNMKKTLEGSPGMIGSKSSWSGNSEVGEGSMTLTETVPNQKIGIRLDFLKPFKDTSQVTFTFTPEAGGTKVLWAMDGNMNPFSKIMCLFMSMDKMIGGDFEQGLASLKKMSEAAAGAAAMPK